MPLHLWASLGAVWGLLLPASSTRSLLPSAGRDLWARRIQCTTETPAPQHGCCSPGPKWELERQLAVMNTQFNRRVLIDLFVWNDDLNSSRHIIYV